MIYVIGDRHGRELTGFLDWVYHAVSFTKWFFGHFHTDTEFPTGIIGCFDIVWEI